MADLLQDARFGMRGMRREPGFTVAAVLTLALGIGANTAMFSVLYGVWLSPVKYPQGKWLVDVSMQQRSGNRFRGGTSRAHLAEWEKQSRTMEAFGAHRYAHQVNITGEEGAEEAIGHRVSANLFGMLGVRPAIGRPMEADADRSGGRRQALIAYAWWKRRFGGDPSVSGRRIRVNDETFTITGVMPEGFAFPPMIPAANRPVIWTSLNLPADERGRAGHSLAVIGRLKPGVSIEQAQAEMDTIAAGQSELYPQEEGGWGVKVTSLSDVRQLDGVRPPIVLVMTASSLLLLIACVNTTNLLLARAAGREREMAIRRALGVTWGRLARQLLTESGLLALVGGTAGLLMTNAMLPWLKRALPANMPRANQIEVNTAVLAFTLAVSLLTGLLFGLIPAIRPNSALSQGSTATRANRTARVLLTIEIALALSLLTGAGLLVESLRRILDVDLGFRKEHALTMRMKLSERTYGDGLRVRAFREELLRRVRALPDVEAAGTVSSLPMGLIMQGTEYSVEGPPETERVKHFADFSNTSTDYLRAMGIPLVAGRYFAKSDEAGAGPVTIVSASLARAWWLGDGALGKRIRIDGLWFTIVGIAKDVRQLTASGAPDVSMRAAGGHIYVLNDQLPLRSQGTDMGRFNVLVVRTRTDSGAMAESIRRVVAQIDKNQPVAGVATMENVVEVMLESRRLSTLLLELFAGLAVVLAAVGVFGVASYAVAQRMKEIGIRIALGATTPAVLAAVARETLQPTAIGTAIGVAGIAIAWRWLAGFLYGVAPLEPVVIAKSAMVLVSTVAAAGLLPARRALRVDPTAVLRQE